MKNIPLFFFHKGFSSYVPKTIAQAQKSNKRVILLGDESNEHVKVEHYKYSDYESPDLALFNNNYRHMSTNAVDFEHMCIARWFVLKNFLIDNNLDDCFYVDTDIMVYSNITEEMQKFQTNKAAILCPIEQPFVRWAASGHSSYWTKEGLIEFCEFINKTYSTPINLVPLREKWAYHVNNNKPGGICDMALIWLYYRKHGGDKIAILSEVIEDSTYDDNVNSAENRYKGEYRMANNVKEIKWENQIPFCYNLKQKKWVRFNTLHFQGHTGKILLEGL